MAKNNKKESNDNFVENIIDADFKDEMENGFYEYAYEVITDRALPDVRDGFKPVHRRILYAMKDLGIVPSSPYKKSARIIGEVIGKYHPHGDTSAYGAAVRLAQSFKNNIPLIEGHGNFGSISGDGAAAMRYCLVGNTLIPTNKGLLKMDEIVPDSNCNTDNKIHMKIKSFGGIRNNSEMFFNSGKHPIIQIVLENGLELQGSYNHPIMVSDNIVRFNWKTLEEVYVGEYAIIDVNTNNTMFGTLNLSNKELIDIIENEIMNDSYNSDLNYKLRISDKDTMLRFKDLFLEYTKVSDSLILANIFKTENKNLVKELQIFFLNIGVYSSIEKDNKAEYILTLNFNGKLDFQREFVLHKDLRKVMYVKIKEIHMLPEEIVYSIRVSSNCHSFIGNGFINHNTEMRLSKTSPFLLDDLDKNVVDMVDNYDGEETEPVILPALFPNLLINGTNGIAVGMASNIPLHNFTDVKNSLFYYLDNPKCNIDDLIDRLKGPDFPTGGTIINIDEFKEFYKTGEGSITVKSKIDVVPGDYGKTNLIIKDIPFSYSARVDPLKNSIINKVVDKKLDEISDVRDESDKDGMAIVLEVKKGVDIDNLIKKLYTITDLKVNEKYNFLAMCDNKPIILNLLEYYRIFTDFQIEIITRKSQYLLNKSNNRIHIVDGLIRAVDLMDLIVDVIRSSANEQIAKNLLMGKKESVKLKFKEHEKKLKLLSFTDIQSESILEYKLRRLTNLEINKLLSEKERLEKEIIRLNKLIKSKSLKIKEIKSNIENMEKIYHEKRKTTLTNEKIDKYIEEKIIENIYLTLDKFYYLKLIDKNSFDRSSVDINEFRLCVETTSEDVFLSFSKKGFCNKLNLNKLPILKTKDKGTPIDNLTDFNKDDEIIFRTLLNGNENKDLIFVTKKGFIKKVKLNNFISSRSLISSTNLKDDDELIYIGFANDNEEIILTTSNNYITRFKIKEIPLLKKTSVGVVGAKFKDINDNVNYVALISSIDKSIEYNNKKILLKNIKLKKRASKMETIE